MKPKCKTRELLFSIIVRSNKRVKRKISLKRNLKILGKLQSQRARVLVTLKVKLKL
jgi:hypothetical protein